MQREKGFPLISYVLTSLFSTASIRLTFPFFDRLYALGSDDSQYLPYDERLLAEDHWRPFKARAAFFEAVEAAEAEDAMEGELASDY